MQFSERLLKLTSKGAVTEFTTGNERRTYPLLDFWCPIDLATAKFLRRDLPQSLQVSRTAMLSYTLTRNSPVDLRSVSVRATPQIHHIQSTFIDLDQTISCYCSCYFFSLQICIRRRIDGDVPEKCCFSGRAEMTSDGGGLVLVERVSNIQYNIIYFFVLIERTPLKLTLGINF